MATTTTTSSALDGFLHRYKALRAHGDTTNELLENLIMHINDMDKQLEESAKKLDDAQLDVQDARNSRRQFQQELRSTTSQLSVLEKENINLKNRNPYIALLIDGDGLMFEDRWVQQGLEGGKKAANTLYTAVANHCSSESTSVKVLCAIYANIGGLAKAMVRDGVIDDALQMEEFVRGFNQSNGPFDFIDVGYGKERADTKLQEMTRWHLGNVNCKQLLLGISHDNGYAPFLDNILLNDQMRERVTIIEGVPTAQEILATNVEILDLEMELFRKDKLVARVANHDPRKTSHEQIPVFTSPSPSNSSIVTPSTHSGSYAFAANSISGAAPAPKISTPLSKQFTAPTRSKTGGRKGAGNWSPGPRGFDIQVKVSAAALNAMKNRKGDNKLCNNFFARQECNKGSECPFVHNYTASSDEIDAIKQLSRMNPCVNGQYCEDTKCIYGHHCPSVVDGVCGHPYCRFARDAHPPGTTFKNKSIDQNESLNYE